MSDKKTEYDSFVKAQKEKERDTKALKKVELQLKAALDSLANIKLVHEKILQQVIDFYDSTTFFFFCELQI